MDLDSLKGKTIDDATLDALKKHVGEFSTRAETAEEKARKAAKESIDGRKGKDAAISRLMEALGIDEIDQLDSLPSPKGQADAIKQFEAKLKRAERDLGEKSAALDELTGKYATERRERALAAELARHPVREDRIDDLKALVSMHLHTEGDDILFRGRDGKTAAFADGVAAFVKARPDYLRPAGDGARGAPAGRQQAPGTKSITRSEFDALDPGSRMAAIRGGAAITD